MARLTDKVILVTGATSGIGADIARLCGREGAAVIVAGRNAERGGAVAAESGGNARFMALDITSETAWRETIRQVVSDCGRLDVLVNNAAYSEPGTIETTTLEAFNRVHETNVQGLFLGCQAAIAVMKEQASPASIINILSSNALKPRANTLAYSSSKSAGITLTRTVALHCAEQKYPIRCNGILPGVVDTPLLEDYLDKMPDREQAMAAILAPYPIGRFLTGTEIASGAVFLASEESSGMTGAMLSIDGGATAG